jgi:hypothetical protein
METTLSTLARHRVFEREHAVRVEAAGGSAMPSGGKRGGRATAS